MINSSWNRFRSYSVSSTSFIGLLSVCRELYLLNLTTNGLFRLYVSFRLIPLVVRIRGHFYFNKTHSISFHIKNKILVFVFHQNFLWSSSLENRTVYLEHVILPPPLPSLYGRYLEGSCAKSISLLWRVRSPVHKRSPLKVLEINILLKYGGFSYLFQFVI